jgi:hypothetical protein
MGLIKTQEIPLPIRSDKLESFGFKFSNGAHISKTMMLNEITKLIAACPNEATLEDYQNSILHENVLLKSTQSNRKETFSRLRSLYGLDYKIPLFSIYRKLILFDLDSSPLLSFLVSWARDPLLRASTGAIFHVNIGDLVNKYDIQESIQNMFPGKYSINSLGTTSRNISSTWKQSGHLIGKGKKTRIQVKPRPASVAFALLLGDMCDYHGENLFSSSFCKLLDLNPVDAHSLAVQAHRENLLTLKSGGSVVEVTFNQYEKFLEEL